MTPTILALDLGTQTGWAIANPNGTVTSGTQSPSLNKAIGMGYVPAALSAPGSEIHIDVRGKALKAQVVKVPFYKPA